METLTSHPTDKPKLILVGSTFNPTHIKNYHDLVKDYFREVVVIGTKEVDFCRSIAVNFSLKNPLETRKNIKRLKAILKEEDPDIIHVHQANSCAYLTGKANEGRKPFVLTPWGSDVLLSDKAGYLKRQMIKKALSYADYMTSNSRILVKRIQDLGIHTETVMANFGIEYDNIEIPEKEEMIYSNRNLAPLYNVDQIIKAFAVFHEKHPSWKLIVGSKGDSLEELKKLAHDILPEDSYEFIGFVSPEEKVNYYLRSKIWVSVPDSDSSSQSLYEAMGYGCIPVVSDLPANRECINDNENGCVVTESLEASLERALTLDLSTVQKQNISIVETTATKEVNRKKYCDLYSRILNSN